MNAVHYIKLLLRYGRWLCLVPLLCAVTVFFLTKNAKQKYSSSTSLYTGVASGYSITSTEDERLDYFAVNNAFDNLVASAKSRETIEEVALHLLAEHLLVTKPDPQVLGTEGFIALKKLVGSRLIAKARSIGNADDVYSYLHAVYSSKADNEIAQILTVPGSFYNIDDLKSNIVVTRLNTSDILEVDYTCSDPAVCQRVLELHTQVFTYNYNHLKSDQTASAVEYFEKKLAEVRDTLRSSEDNLNKFGKDNRIINYYEQTRYMAQSKDEVDKEVYAQEMIQSGCKNALALIEKRLSNREKQIINSASIINLRERLSDINTDVERARLYANPEKVAEFTAKQTQLEDSIKTVSNQYMSLNYSIESVPRTSLLQQWIDNAVAYDKATAGLAVLQNQKKDYLNEFDEFAPLGSSLKRLDRQVDINEQEFLAILHGLNLARLRQSNLSLNSNIVIQDKPYFPLKPEKSTRMLLIIVAVLVGFIAGGSVVIGREMMDSSIRSPERAKKIIGLRVAGVSPVSALDKTLAYKEKLRGLLAGQMVSNLLPFITVPIEEKGSAMLSLISLRNDLYKSADLKMLNELLSAIFRDVCWVVPGQYIKVFAAAIPMSGLVAYSPSISQLNYKTAAEIAGRDLSKFELVIYVSPCLSECSIPAAMVHLAALNLVAIGANETWLSADKEALTKVEAVAAGAPLHTWLTNTEETNLEGIIGEIPKKRSWLRRKVKKLITLNLR